MCFSGGILTLFHSLRAGRELTPEGRLGFNPRFSRASDFARDRSQSNIWACTAGKEALAVAGDFKIFGFSRSR
jgi:hypothetical protein